MRRSALGAFGSIFGEPGRIARSIKGKGRKAIVWNLDDDVDDDVLLLVWTFPFGRFVTYIYTPLLEESVRGCNALCWGLGERCHYYCSWTL